MTTTKKFSTMSRAQREYALERVDQIKRELIKRAERKHPIPDTTVGELIKLIKSDALKLLIDKSNVINDYTDIADVFDINTPHLPKKRAQQEALDAIEDMTQKARDEIMLGDDVVALKNIAALEAYKI